LTLPEVIAPLHPGFLLLSALALPQVILDKNSRLRTVVNKVETISNEFRVFPMEVIAGEPSLCTSTRENGVTFHMDYREVYWNSRLEREHKRIVDLLGAGDVVCDMFCGIGPFVVPAAAAGCSVYANDLNPASVRWLRKNVAVNKVRRRVRVSNMCGREFLRQLVASAGSPAPASPAASPAAAAAHLPVVATSAAPLATQPAAAPAAPPAAAAAEPPIESPALVFGEFQHVLMNLPASGIEFLDSFLGAFDRHTWRGPLPRVHCYCFSKEADAQGDAIRRAEAALGCALPDAEAHIVRDVAPGKLMLCVSFVLPDAVAWRDDAETAEAKRQRTGESESAGAGA
jgi:tRNA (guanine37-N1)-methyltransferase